MSGAPCVPRLYTSAQRGSALSCRVLLRQDANVNARVPNGDTALHVAALHGHYDVCKLLLEHGADVSSVGRTPLHFAAERGHDEVCRLLLQHSADPSLPCPIRGYAALHLAAIESNDSTCEVLLRHGADVNQRAEGGGETPLHVAANRSFQGTFETLLTYGANPMIEDAARYTALKTAMLHNKMFGSPTALCDMLFAASHWPSPSALHAAAALRNADAALWLLRDGPHRLADPHASDDFGWGRRQQLLQTAREVAPWPGAPPPCAKTAAILAASLKPWSPLRHWFFHSGVRAVVHTLLLVARSEPPGVPTLPRELWFLLCSFVTRADHIRELIPLV